MTQQICNCRLCGRVCPVDTSLFYAELYGQKHLNKLDKTDKADEIDEIRSGIEAVVQKILSANKLAKPTVNPCLQSSTVKKYESNAVKKRREAEEAMTTAPKPIKRVYLLCEQCKTVFVPDPYLLTAEKEKEEYDLHENNDDDASYRVFLSRTVDEVIQHFEGSLEVSRSCSTATRLRGLDFGCGPGPTICHMLSSRNKAVARAQDLLDELSASHTSSQPFYEVINYDKYFPHSGPESVSSEALVDGCVNRYDFITATEVVEHLRDAGLELRRLWELLREPSERHQQRGIPSALFIMTKRATIYSTNNDGSTVATAPSVSTDKFTNWHYKNDPTHITFFTVESFEWCRDVLFGGPAKCRLTIVGPDVIKFEKM